MANEDDLPEGNSPELKEKLEELEREVDKPTQITRIKRLKELQDKLEGTHKIDRVKKVKKNLMILQIIGIIVLFPVLMFFDGASLDPLHLPIYYPILMLFGWVLILFVESFVFRIIRIKRHRSKSTKYLLTKNSMKKSISVMIVALIVFGVIYTPFLTEEINERSSIQSEVVNVEEEDDDYHESIILTTRCVFSLRELKSLTIRPHGETHDAIINVTLSERRGDEQTTIELRDDEEETFEFDSDKFEEYVLHLSAEDPFVLEYETRMELIERRMDVLAIMAFLYIGTFLQWSAVLYPIRIRYTGKGIYR